MTSFSYHRVKAVVFVCAYLVLFTPYAQTNKEDRNYYPKPQPIKKSELKIQAAPIVFSPHLSYREQKKMYLASKKAGGITFLVKSRRSKVTNYKQPTNRPSKVASEEPTTNTDATESYTRYVLDSIP